MSYLLRLPRFIPWTGYGGICLGPPGIFTNATGHLFAVRASKDAEQSLADTLLNRAAGKIVSYQALWDIALVSFVNIERCTSGTEPIGWLPAQECAFWVPLLEKKLLGLPRFVMWAPYIFINYAIGMVTGREIWGWSKEIANITIQPATQYEGAKFVCETTVFRTLSRDTRGEESAPLFTITSSQTSRAASEKWTENRAAIPHLLAHLVEAAASLDRLIGYKPHAPTIALKQFRDSGRPILACYQEIVNAPCLFKRIDAVDPIVNASDHTLTIYTYDSHKIVKDIFGGSPSGPSKEIRVEAGVRAEFDFEALPGDVIAPLTARLTSSFWKSIWAFFGRFSRKSS